MYVYREKTMAEPSRGRMVSVRLSDEEYAHLDGLVEVHRTDRSAFLRALIVSAPLWSVHWDAASPPPPCARCGGAPPPGFACVTCGAGGSVSPEGDTP